MANKITWADKVALQEKPDVVAENKVTAADMNQIKTAVNETIEEMPSNLKNGIAVGSVRTSGSAEESDSYKLGKYAFAEGHSTTASEDNSHAEGISTAATGTASHAEGSSTRASGPYSHAEGFGTYATRASCHAEGDQTRASGICSHAEGSNTIASGENQHAQGKYNIEDTTSAHIVGNGSYHNNSNAHTLDWSGNAWFAGDVYTGSTSGKNKDDGSKKLATEEYVNSLIETGTNDNGRYEKYANGMLKCYYTQTISTDIKNSWGSLSISPIIQLQDYPITFKAITSLNMSVVGVVSSAWIINAGDYNSHRPCPIQLCAGNSINLPNDFRISVCAIGTWK